MFLAFNSVQVIRRVTHFFMIIHVLHPSALEELGPNSAIEKLYYQYYYSCVKYTHARIFYTERR